MLMEIDGRAFSRTEEKNGVSKSGEDWKCCTFVIALRDENDTKVAFSVFNDRVDLLDGIGAGESVTVTFSPTAREYNGRWYSSLKLYDIVRKGGSKNISPVESAPVATAQAVPEEQPIDDNLPF